MAKITRKTQKIFASSASNIGEFGSLAAGTPGTTTDPIVIQNLANYQQGWSGAILSGGAPAIEDMNAMDYLETYQLAYLMQAGIAEYDSSTTYYIGSLVNDGTGVIYKSLINANLGYAVTVTTAWAVVTPGLTLLGDMIYADATPQAVRLAGNTTATRKFLRQLGTGSVSAAPVWDQPITTDVLAEAAGTVAPNGYLGCELFANNSTGTSIPGSTTASNFLTQALSVGRWLVGGSVVISGPGSGSALVQVGLVKCASAMPTDTSRDLMYSTVAASALQTITFPHSMLSVTSASSPKQIAIWIINSGSAAITAYANLEAVQF